MTWAATSTEPFFRGAIFYDIFMRMEEGTRMGRSLSLEGMGSPWVTFENAVSSVQQKNEVLLPGSMTAAAVSWQGRLGVAGGGFAVISSRPTLFKMSLCAANLDEGRREGGSGYFSTKWEGERSQIIDVSLPS